MFLVLLDLSAAVDTINHGVLLSRLLSIVSKAVLFFGVPCKALFWGLDFSLYYSDPMTNIARKHGLLVNMYADDTQLYLPYPHPPPRSTNGLRRKCMESCIVDIKSWMTSNKLKFNDDKTELIIVM